MVNVMLMVMMMVTEHAFDLRRDVWVILILILILILNVIFDDVVNYQMVVVVLYQKSTSTTHTQANKKQTKQQNK